MDTLEAASASMPLDAVLTTAELSRRSSRAPDYKVENESLLALAQVLTESPKNTLQKLVDTALTLCRADSAGISLLEEEAGREIVRWHAVAGQWAPFQGNSMPRDNGPSGTLDCNATLPISHAHPHFAQFAGVRPLLIEALLAPFYVDGQAVGTLWVVAHDARRQFDAEDQRVLENLATFATTAYQALVSLDALEERARSLRESERRFREMIDALPAVIYTTDAEGRLTHFNPAAAEFSGRVPQLGTDHWCVSWKLYRSDGTPLPHEECPMAIALKEGRAVRGEETIAERPDGTRRWFVPYPTPLRDDTGRLIGGINMLVDVTERKQAEEVRARLAAIVESSDDAIISKDLHGVITSWNKGAERLFGYTAEEAIGQPVTMMIPAERLDEEQLILDQLKRGERIEHFDTTRVRRDGAALDISLTVSPIRDASGRVIGASKTARDITERKRADEELRAADRRKSEFLALLAHELRNPLAGIHSALRVLRLTLEDRKAERPAIDVLERQVGHIIRLVDDLLDLSRISRGRIELRREPVELASVVNGAIEAVRPLCEEMDHELTVTMASRRTYLNVDPIRLVQVVSNLLSNACKFTERGGRIRLTVEREGTQAVIRVQDTGIGIAAEQLPRIFDMFMQVDASLERSRDGLGIGLTLVKYLVEAHDGSVEARSAGVGQGSEFVVRLPVLSEPLSSLPREPSSVKQVATVQRRILVVDDNRDATQTLAMVLKLGGHEVHTAHDGLEAVEAAAKIQPDVILLDIGLPRLNGYEAARRIREQQRDKGVLLVALTGWGQPEDRRCSQEAGFDVHMVKPINHAALSKLLVELGGSGSQD